MTPLDESPLWSRQAEAYQRLGPRAFSEGIVPWRATTCPLIADVEAELIAAFAEDVAAPDDTPLTIVDVGAGSGRLGFHLAAALARRNLHARLVLADLAESNLDALATQPQLAELHRDGRLTFLRLDALAPPRFDGPCVFLAHYLFDTLPHAAYRRCDGALLQGFVDEAWRWDFRPCSDHHSELAGRPDGTWLVPVGAARALRAWAEAVSGPLLVLAADKGVEPRSVTQDPQLALHDSVSAGVDFDALSVLVREDFAWLAPVDDSAVFALHALVRGELPRTRAAWSTRGSHNEVRALLGRFEALLRRPTEPDALLDFIDQALADPDLLAQLTGRLREAALTPSQAERLVSSLAAAAQRHFIFKQLLDVPFELALTAHHLGALNLAVALYLLSLREGGAHPTPLINLALAQHALGQPALARQALEVVLETTPDHVRARALLTEWSGE